MFHTLFVGTSNSNDTFKTNERLDQDLGKDMDFNSNAARRMSSYSGGMHMNPQHLSQRQGSMSYPSPIIPTVMSPVNPSVHLPAYIKPLHDRLGMDEIVYLEKKGALTIPPTPLRDELLRCYAEFIHPFMPLLDLGELVGIIDRNDGEQSVSLLLFQAIMFAGVASADISFLKAAGYDTRREARRDFFQKTRLLYDFDYEVDRISLIQSLLLMTYWYETPDDQKDSHHWMGIAVSLSHTIGLHRNPEKSSTMDLPRRRLWKRIWWSTYMRDRLIALGMRRPTRIKDSDFDVPMLTVDDFEKTVLGEGPSCIPANCTIMRDADKQRRTAVMCIEMTKLCILVSNVLSVQYSVISNGQGDAAGEEANTRTTMVLVAKRLQPGNDEVQECDKQLRQWKEDLPESVRYSEPTWSDVDALNEDTAVNSSLLHLIYFAALSALHRPLVLPSSGAPPRTTPADQLEVSRKAVRLAANETTKIANSLYVLDLVRYLPTTGITVLLPAIIIHLLDIKALDESTRRSSLQGFCQCMQVMSRLRDIYAAADYSTAFLEAAIRKAEITLPVKAAEMKEPGPESIITSAQGLLDAGRRLNAAEVEGNNAFTPPPDGERVANNQISDDLIAQRLNTYLADTPPDSEHQMTDGLNLVGLDTLPAMGDFEPELDFDSMVNLDAAGETWLMDDGAYAAMQGESTGLPWTWMKGMNDDTLDATTTV